jgi:hypothetical protein
MQTEIKVDISYEEVLTLVRKLPIKEKIGISEELKKEFLL